MSASETLSIVMAAAALLVSLPGALLAAAQGGNGNYSYSWSNNFNGALNAGLVASLYTVTVTDAEGCTDITAFDLPEPPPLSLEFTTVDIDCKENPSGKLVVTVGGSE